MNAIISHMLDLHAHVIIGADSLLSRMMSNLFENDCSSSTRL